MRHPLVPAEATKTVSSASVSSLDPAELLRVLLAQLSSADLASRQPLLASEAETDEIVLDLECDGYRYLLVRSAKPTRAQVELSPREKEIVRMVAQGHSNKIIAAVLNISSWTVCTYLRRVFAKLGVGSRAAMVARLHDLGAVRIGQGQPTNLGATSLSEPRKADPPKTAQGTAKVANLPSARRQSA